MAMSALGQPSFVCRRNTAIAERLSQYRTHLLRWPRTFGACCFADSEGHCVPTGSGNVHERQTGSPPHHESERQRSCCEPAPVYSTCMPTMTRECACKPLTNTIQSPQMRANTAATSSTRSRERAVKSRNADFTVGTASEKSNDFLLCKQVSIRIRTQHHYRCVVRSFVYYWVYTAMRLGLAHDFHDQYDSYGQRLGFGASFCKTFSLGDGVMAGWLAAVLLGPSTAGAQFRNARAFNSHLQNSSMQRVHGYRDAFTHFTSQRDVPYAFSVFGLSLEPHVSC
jgi:hypothetical protein